MVEDFYKWFMSEPEQDYYYRREGNNSPYDGDLDYEMYYKSMTKPCFNNCVAVDLFRYSGKYSCWVYISIRPDQIDFSLTNSHADEVQFDILDFLSTDLTEEELFQSSLVQDLPPVSLNDLRMLIKVARRLQIDDDN